MRTGRSSYRITEPLITFYQAVMRPAWTALEQRRGAEVWRRSQPRFTSAVLGLRFEELVRHWTVRFAAPEAFGGVVAEVGRATVNDPANRTSHELDVLAVGEPYRDRLRPVLAIGEVQWSERVGAGHLARLERVRELLRARRGLDAAGARLLLASGTGFADDLVAADRSDVILVDLHRLYHTS